MGEGWVGEGTGCSLVLLQSLGKAKGGAKAHIKDLGTLF